jgi:hypothetical protein
MILVGDKYYVDTILGLSLIVVGFVPFLGVRLFIFPFTRDIRWIFLVFHVISLPLWLIVVNHIEVFLGGGLLHLSIRGVGL